MIVPYIKLGKAESKLPIESVCIGPGKDPELTKKSVELFLKGHGYGNVRIVSSEVPYRT